MEEFEPLFDNNPISNESVSQSINQFKELFEEEKKKVFDLKRYHLPLKRNENHSYNHLLNDLLN